MHPLSISNHHFKRKKRMYLHLGQDVVVRQQDIVGIFDMDNTTVSPRTRQFLKKAEKNKRVTYVSMELPKSFVVCCPKKKNERDQESVYVSQISPSTLRKRARRMDNL